MSGEYRLRITVRNNLILRAIDALGFSTVAAFCRQYGLKDTAVSLLVSMRKPPINQSGEFCAEAKELMEALGAAPSDLWTDKQLTMRLDRNSGERVVDEGAIEYLLESNVSAMTLPSPEDDLAERQGGRLVEAMLSTLTPKEASVIRLRNGLGCDEHTREEIAEQFDVTRARIGQIEAKALRKLRHPAMSIAHSIVAGKPLSKIDAMDMHHIAIAADLNDMVKKLKKGMTA